MLLINSIHQIYYYTNIFNGSIEPEKTTFAAYSTSEQKIGIWTDGRPIYRRVITGTISASAGEYNLTSLLNDNSISFVRKVEGYFEIGDPANAVIQGIPGTGGTANNRRGAYSFQRETGTLRIETASDFIRTNRVYMITVEYVKNS